MDCQGVQSPKEGQEDQGTLEQPGGVPPWLFYFSLVLLAFLLALGSLAMHQGIIPIHQAIPMLKPALKSFTVNLLDPYKALTGLRRP